MSGSLWQDLASSRPKNKEDPMSSLPNSMRGENCSYNPHLSHFYNGAAISKAPSFDSINLGDRLKFKVGHLKLYSEALVCSCMLSSIQPARQYNTENYSILVQQGRGEFIYFLAPIRSKIDLRIQVYNTEWFSSCITFSIYFTTVCILFSDASSSWITQQSCDLFQSFPWQRPS